MGLWARGVLAENAIHVFSVYTTVESEIYDRPARCAGFSAPAFRPKAEGCASTAASLSSRGWRLRYRPNTCHEM